MPLLMSGIQRRGYRANVAHAFDLVVAGQGEFAPEKTDGCDEGRRKGSSAGNTFSSFFLTNVYGVTDMNTISRKHTRTMLRPLAALLIMGMAGSVYATSNNLESACVANSATNTSGNASLLCGATAQDVVATASAAARSARNDLHPYIGFADSDGL